MNRRASSARGFTLLETMLAAAIASLVVFACLGLFYLMNRTDRSMEARANEQSELERLRFVMERTFSTLLMSDESKTLKPGELAVATAVDAMQNKDASATNDAIKAMTDKTASGAGSSSTDRFGSGSDRFSSGSKGASGSAGGSGGRFSSTERFKSTNADGSKVSRFASDQQGSNSDSGDNRALRPPPPPRLFLAADPLAAATMDRQPLQGETLRMPEAPQRLEVVLYQSPVPTSSIDPVELALASAKKVKAASRFRTEAATASPQQGSSGDNKTVGDQAIQDEAMSTPVRAVRGALELRPQPAKLINSGQVSSAAYGQTQQATGLWQVWWVPLPRLTSDGLEVPLQLPSQPTQQSDAQLPEDIPQPFLVASNLRYLKWTVFHERERKVELSSTWSSDLPAYVEVEAQTASGMNVNWMFEIDWANGPEVARPSNANGMPGGTADKAGDTAKQTGSFDAGKSDGGTGAAAPGSSFQKGLK